MRIKNVRVYLIDSGTMRPIIAEIVTDEGIIGIGEAAIAYGAGATAAAGMIKDLAVRFLIGEDPMQIEKLWTRMYDHSFWSKGGGAIVFAGISAIEQALWDIKGKALSVPVYELLGGRFASDIEVYANGWCFGHETPAAFAKAGEKTAKDGYKAMKCYPLAMKDPKGTLIHVSRRMVDRDFCESAFQKIKQLRAAVGPEIDILIDLSGALTTDETVRLCRKYEDFGITFIEEPADPFDVGALERIAQGVSIPIALGERIYTRYGFRKIFEQQVVSIVQPDIGNTGGIMETKKIAAMAEAYNMRVAPHNCGSPLMTAVCLQLDVCTSNFMIQETYPYLSLDEGYVEFLDNPPESRIKNGRLDLPTAPGLGINLLEKKVEQYRWADASAA